MEWKQEEVVLRTQWSDSQWTSPNTIMVHHPCQMSEEEMKGCGSSWT
jgi:hypothetical protein